MTIRMTMHTQEGTVGFLGVKPKLWTKTVEGAGMVPRRGDVILVAGEGGIEVEVRHVWWDHDLVPTLELWEQVFRDGEHRPYDELRACGWTCLRSRPS